MCLYIFVPSARPASATHLWSKWVCSLGRHGESGNLHTHTHTHAQGRAVAVTCVVPIIPNQIRWRPRGAAGSGRGPTVAGGKAGHSGQSMCPRRGAHLNEIVGFTCVFVC